MPPNEHALETALEDLRRVEVLAFTTTPSSIGPFGQSALEWRVDAPPGVKLKLNGREVPHNGAQVVRPVETRNFTLTATAVGLVSQLAQRTVEVNLDACTTLDIAEADVQASLLAVVSRLLAQDEKVSNRKPPSVDVTPDGIVLKLRFEVEITGRNPDFNVDALIGLGVDSEGVVPYFREFKADLDFSFWEDVLNFTIGAFVGGPFLHLAIAIAESNAQAEARRDILDGVQDAIDQFLAVVPTGWAPQQVVLRDDGIDVRICPRPGLTLITSFRQPEFRLVAPGSSTPDSGEQEEVKDPKY